MRVTHVAPTSFGRDGLFGGGERYPLELARALAPHVDCELIAFGRVPLEILEPSGLRLRVLAPQTYLHGHVAHPLALGLPAALAHTDIIHTHHMYAAPSRIAALMGSFRGSRLAVTDHGLAGSDWRGVLPRLIDVFLLVSHYSAEQLHSPPARTKVIYGGVDAERFHPEPEGTRSGVLFVGRLTPHKGVDRLMEALPGGARLTVVGSRGHDPHPPESGYPALLRHLASERDVAFRCALSDADLALEYRRARVLVLPSVHRTCYGQDIPTSELLGLVILEAMASGTPVVASRVGGVPEIVEHGITGFLVEPGNVLELRERLVEVLGDRALSERMGAAAREMVLERFTWDRVARRCLEVYEDLGVR